MPVFRYSAIDASAATVTGRIEAASKAAVVDQIHAAGHVPLRIEETGRLFSLAGRELNELLERRLSLKSLALLTGQLATFLEAGLALDQALGILEGLAAGRHEKSCVRTLAERVTSGSALSDAMAAQPKNFPDFYVSMVRAGEVGGGLDAVLLRLADFLERSQMAREHVKSALLYPIIVALTCFASIAVLFTVVVPQFRPVFEQAGDTLPVAARGLLVASELFQDFWWLGILAPVVLGLGLRWQLRRPESRAWWDRLVLGTPVAGPLVIEIEVARFSRTLGTLLKNGVSLMAALSIARETVGNRVLSEDITRIMGLVKVGKGLAEPFAQSKVFPPLAIHLVRVGEETGRQEDTLLKLADAFERESRRTLDRLLALMGPAITIALGGIVAVVISTILTAVLSVYDLAL